MISYVRLGDVLFIFKNLKNIAEVSFLNSVLYPWWLSGKRVRLQCRSLGSIPGSGSLVHPLQCSCLENPADRGA